MNKLTIPAILVATVMVAGIFAFMPVEQASTVHTTLASGDNTAVAGEVTDGSTTITSNDAGTSTRVYTYTTDEIAEVLAIEITADITAFTDAGDIVRVSAITLDGIDLDPANGAPFQVSIGTDGAADTINLLLEMWNAAVTVEAGGWDPIIVSPNTDLVVTVQVVEVNGNDADTAIPVTVTFFTNAPGSTIEDVAIA